MSEQGAARTGGSLLWPSPIVVLLWEPREPCGAIGQECCSVACLEDSGIRKFGSWGGSVFAVVGTSLLWPSPIVVDLAGPLWARSRGAAMRPAWKTITDNPDCGTMCLDWMTNKRDSIGSPEAGHGEGAVFAVVRIRRTGRPSSVTKCVCLLGRPPGRHRPPAEAGSRRAAKNKLQGHAIRTIRTVGQCVWIG